MLCKQYLYVFFDRVNSYMSICFDWDLNNLFVNASFSNLELFKSLSSLPFNSTEAYLASLWLNSLKKSCTTLMYIFIFFLESFVKMMLQFNSYFLYTYIEHFFEIIRIINESEFCLFNKYAVQCFFSRNLLLKTSDFNFKR